jgi:uncharacterized protein YndB with AHSA1/START domain
MSQTITVQATINALIETVWQLWITPSDIIKWYNASDGWHTPHAENDLQVGSKFLFRIEAKDGSEGFDFNGMHGHVVDYEMITYAIEGGKKSVTSNRMKHPINGNKHQIIFGQHFF